jgi:F-type H+-transporting ATPase subunit delta
LAYKNLMDEELGLTRGVVRAAKPLSADQLKGLEEKIRIVLKKKITLTFEEDRSLLGGVVAQAGGWTFDDSLDMHLNNLNDSLIK